MAKLTLNDLVNLQNEQTAVSRLNDNNTKLENIVERSLSRYSYTPNHMNTQLDMNFNRIINLPPAASSSEPVRLNEITEFVERANDLDALLPNSVTNNILADMPAYTFKGNNTAVNGNPQDVSLDDLKTLLNTGQYISVKDYGAKGDGATDDYAAITAAIAEAVSTKLPLLFPTGTYITSDTLQFGYDELKVHALGHVILRYTGSGYGVAFDAGEDPSDNVFKIEFGWSNRIFIDAPNAVCAVLVRGIHHSDFRMQVMGASDVCYWIQYSVLANFDLRASGNYSTGWTNQPDRGILVDQRDDNEATTACRFYNTIIEKTAKEAITLLNCDYCSFYGGTSENNGGGGIIFSDKCEGVYIENLFCEFNCQQDGLATLYDYYIDGRNHVIVNCVGNSHNGTIGSRTSYAADSLRVVGTGSTFINCSFRATRISGGHNIFISCINFDTDNLGYLINTGTSNRFINTHEDGSSGSEWKPDVLGTPSMISANLSVGDWVNYGGSYANAGYHKNGFNEVTLSGAVKNGSLGSGIFVLPSGYRPLASRTFAVPNVSDTSTVYITVTSAGAVTHTGGTNTFVGLDGIRFLAEQ